jgi:hypothetical protein
MIMSVAAASDPAGNERSISAAARCDSRVSVGWLSLLSAPPSKEAIAKTAATAATAQTAIVRRGWAALALASARMDITFFMEGTLLLAEVDPEARQREL